MIYFATNTSDLGKRDSIYALNLLDGKLKWKKDVNGLASNPAPICDGNRLYINGYHGILCMNAFTGAFLWNFTQTGMYDFAPIFLSDGKLFTYSSQYEQTQLYALSASTGIKLWQVKTAIGEAFDEIGPIVSNNFIYIYASYFVDAYSIKDGSLQWQTRRLDNGDAQWSPVVIDKYGNIAVSSASGMF